VVGLVVGVVLVEDAVVVEDAVLEDAVLGLAGAVDGAVTVTVTTLVVPGALAEAGSEPTDDCDGFEAPVGGTIPGSAEASSDGAEVTGLLVVDDRVSGGAT